jgi:hypothetical protein
MISVSAHAAVVCARVPHLHCLSQCLERGSRFVTSGRPRARALLRAILRRKFGAAARVGQACSIILAASRVHGAVPQTSRGGEAPAPTSARRRVACQASTAPLLRTRARHTTWRAIPHCRDVRRDWSRTEWPAAKKKLCSTCVDHERAESRSAISKPIFADADAKGPLRAAGNPRVAQVLHKLTEVPRPCSRSLQHIGSDARPERRWDTPRNAEPGVDMQRMAV